MLKTRLQQSLVPIRQSEIGLCRGHPFRSVARERRSRHRVSRLGTNKRLALAATPEADLIEVELDVEGMECGACSSRVHEALLELDIVKEAEVSHQDGKASLQVDAPSFFDAMNHLPTIMETIDTLGFKAQPCLGLQDT